MSAEHMNFPKDIHEFLEDYSFTDEKEVYTNGAKLIPLFRVEQALEHYYQPKVGEWIPSSERLPEKETNVLCFVPKADGNVQYGLYVGQIRKVKADDGSGNFWGIPTKECDWTLKGWSYFEHPTIVAWQPLPEPYSSGD